MRAIAIALMLAGGAHADPVTLRMATAVPEGTAWARVGMAFARDVEQLTHGEVRVKWYLGGIAGNELQVLDRMKRDHLDDLFAAGLRAVGIPVVPTSLEDAARSFDQGKFDGYVVMPTAALAFQWSAQTKYITPLATGFLSSCLLIANRAFDALPVESQK